MAARLKISGLAGELAAEFAGTMILILFGVGVVAQVGGGIGDHDSIAWSWGLGVVFGVYVAGRISGAHLNPAVTIALAAFKGFPWRKVAPYSIAQFLGAFVAALLVRWNYTEVLHAAGVPAGVFNLVQGDGPGVGTALARHPDDPALPHLGDHRRGEHSPRREPGAVHHRAGGRRHRHGLGHQRGLRHQPGP